MSNLDSYCIAVLTVGFTLFALAMFVMSTAAVVKVGWDFITRPQKDEDETLEIL